MLPSKTNKAENKSDGPPKKRRNRTSGIKSTLAIRMAATGLSFLTGLAISRGFGAGIAGQYFFFYAIMQLSAIIAAVGFPQLNLIRFARARVRKTVINTKRDFRRSQFCIAAIGGVVVLLSCVVPNSGWSSESSQWITYGLTAGSFLALLRNLSESLKGFNEVITALIIEYLVPSLILLAAIIFDVYFLHSETSQFVIVATIASCVIALVFGTIYFESLVASDDTQPVAVDTNFGQQSSDWTILFANFSENVFQSMAWTLPAILMPWMADDTQAGYFGLAQRLAGIASVILIALMSHFTQVFSYLYESSQEQKLAESFLNASKIALLCFFPFAVAYCCFPITIMNFFGADFKAGWPYLTLLATTHLATLPGGVAIEYLRVVGQQTYLLWLSLCTGIISVIGITVAGLIYGGSGIVLLFASTLAIKRLIAFLMVIRRRHVSSSRVPHSVDDHSFRLRHTRSASQ